jgi:hypothetical protein
MAQFARNQPGDVKHAHLISQRRLEVPLVERKQHVAAYHRQQQGHQHRAGMVALHVIGVLPRAQFVEALVQISKNG